MNKKTNTITYIIIAIIVLVLIIGSLPIWEDKPSSSSKRQRKYYECVWCNGTGLEWDGRSKDSKGNYIYTTCSHCHGTGLWQ